jgi:predicted nuclease with TOPRIM domain
LSLEKKSSELQETFSHVQSEAESLRKKVDDLEAYTKNLACELAEKLRESQEKHSQHEKAAQTLIARNLKLESLIIIYKTTIDDSIITIASLEATLVDTAKLTQTEEMLHTSENAAKETSTRITVLEDNVWS